MNNVAEKSINHLPLNDKISAQIKYHTDLLKTNLQDINSLQELGKLYFELQDYSNAIKYYQRCIDLEPNYASFYALAGAYYNQAQYSEAKSYFLKAIDLEPNSYEANFALGWNYFMLHDFDSALTHFELLFKQGHRETALISRLADCHHELGNISKAELFYRWLCEIDSSSLDNHFSLSANLLLQDEYEEGWFHYRWLFTKPQVFLRGLNLIAWHGEDLQNKTLLVYCDQGTGDIIQMLRFLPGLEEKATKIILFCPKSLGKLVKNILNETTQIVEYEDKKPLEISLPQIDYYCMINAIPTILNTTLTELSGQAYLKVDNKTMRELPKEKTLRGKKFKVGIAWAGSPNNKKDFKRSTSLELWGPILANKKIQFYSLQKGQPAAQLAALNDNIIDLAEDLKEFSDTASYIMQMDLIITVDTSVAHLAGALGKPVWVLLAHVPNWRYGLKGQSTLWYDSMRLFRQPKRGDWPAVIAQVAKALKEEVNG